ncbi:hypothetical protein H4219_005106 [Mycoemilia scoparia]|uniref:Uncharacterized protein n=1 Tax=Mycoemilia scoparia TaxID=417184 RepID=A0A9W7ZQA6_9FUNG|nr:hypothetical protein H4219_005106 [Mycoemilia scoparia]
MYFNNSANQDTQTPYFSGSVDTGTNEGDIPRGDYDETLEGASGVCPFCGHSFANFDDLV